MNRKAGVVAILISSAIIVLQPVLASAATVSDINAQIQQKQAAAANTQKQIDSINSSLQRIDTGIQSTQAQLDNTNSRISESSAKIADLTAQLDQENKNLEIQKKIMDQSLVEIYRFSSRSNLEILFGGDSLGDNANQTNYIQSVEMQVKIVYDRIVNLKNDIAKQKSDTEAEKANLDQLQNNQKGYLDSLSSQKNTSSKIKSNAVGALGDYQKQIASLEAQKSSLLAAQSRIKGGSSMIGGSDLVTSSASWYFSQDDPSWAGNNIGNSDSTIGRYGCALTSLAMVLRYYGAPVNPNTLASNPAYFNDDLIVWPSLYGHYLRSSGGWGDVDNSLDQGHPVIVKLSAYGGTHFVVIKSKRSDGKYDILDPISGSRTYGRGLVIAFYFYY